MFYQNLFFRCRLLLMPLRWGLTLFFPLGLVLPVSAQITPDDSLGAERSVVREEVRVRGAFAELIEGGAQRNQNLFHSFQDFNVNDRQRVYFANPVGVETIFSRITGSDPSHILGTLGVEGSASLFLLNPNGILFGPNAQLDIQGSFTASTGNSVVFENNYHFDTSDPTVPPLLQFKVPLGAQFGDTYAGLIFNLAILQVGEGQHLNLLGGAVVNQGDLVAPGGSISVASLVPGQTATFDSRWRLTGVTLPTLETVEPIRQLVSLASIGNEEIIPPVAVGETRISGQLSVSAHAPEFSQGTLQILGEKIEVDGHLEASAPLGGGNILVGGNFQGQGPLPNAQEVTIHPTAVLKAEAWGQGDGGQIVVWSDQQTHFAGTAIARGGTQGGNGGLVETSSKAVLSIPGSASVDLSAAQGQGGTWLLDPHNVTIAAPPPPGANVSAGGIFSPGSDNAIVDANTLQNALNNGTSVTITTGSTGTQAGNITVASDIFKTLGPEANLSLEAANNITVNSGITIASTGNALNVSLTADTDGSGTGAIVLNDNSRITTRGGSVRLTGESVTINPGTYVETYATGRNGGSVTISAPGVVSLTQSSIDTTASGNGNLNAGAVLIDAGAIGLTNTSIDVASFANSGVAGSVTLQALGGDVILQGDGTTPIFTDTFNTDPIDAGTSTGGFLSIEGQRIQISGYALDARVREGSSGNGGFITLKAFDGVDGSGNDIFTPANTIVINNGTEIANAVERDSSGNGGFIQVQGYDISLENASITASTASPDGAAGFINVAAVGTVNLQGFFTDPLNPNLGQREGGLLAEGTDGGTAGYITVQANQLKVNHGAAIAVNAKDAFDAVTGAITDAGDAGVITINASQVNVNGGQIAATVQSGGNSAPGNIDINIIDLTVNNGLVTSSAISGRAGFLDIDATGTVSLTGLFTNPASSTQQSGGLSAEATGGGIAGNVLITAEELNVNANTIIGVSAKDAVGAIGQAGFIEIAAPTININGGEISAKTEGGGDAINFPGNITFTTETLTAENGQISASTITGLAGNITIASKENPATEVILKNSTIQAAARQAGGDSGFVSLYTTSLIAENTNIASSNISGTAGLGNVLIDEIDTLIATSGTTISASTDTGLAGSVTIASSDNPARSISLTDSTIQAAATNLGGDSGFVTLFVNHLTAENSKIEASNISGTLGYGNVLIDQVETLTATTNSSITASTQTGVAGSVTIDSAGNETDSILLNNSNIVASALSSNGSASFISIGVANITAENNSLIAATNIDDTRGAGIIDIVNVNNLNLSNSQVTTTTDTGQAGQIQVNLDGTPADQVILDGETLLPGNTENVGAGIIAAARQGGDAGLISVNTNDLQIRNGAGIIVSAQGEGTAGNIDIKASTLSLDNGAINATTDAGGSEDSANITIDGLSTLTASNNSQISASTQTGIAGNVTIASDTSPANSISLSDSTIQAAATAEGGDSGFVALYAENLIVNNSRIQTSNVSGTSGKGNIEINTTDLTVNNGLVTASTASGTAGYIDIDATGTVSLSGPFTDPSTSQLTQGGLRAEATQGGNAGNMIITTDQLDINSGAAIAVSASDGIDSSDIIEGILQDTASSGFVPIEAVNIVVETLAENGFVSLDEVNTILAENTIGGLISTESINTIIDTITIENLVPLEVINTIVENLTSAGFGIDQIDIIISDIAEAGIVNIDAKDIQVKGGEIAAEAQSGVSGAITINTNNLTAENGLITSSTTSGIAGLIAVNATDTVSLTGEFLNPISLVEQPGGILAETTSGGRAGNIEITATEQLSVNRGAVIAVSAQDAVDGTGSVTEVGEPGAIQIEALDTQIEGGKITAQTESGGTPNLAGNITLKTQTLTARNGEISASTQAGYAGSVNIATVANPVAVMNLTNSTIQASANASGGQAGSINLAARTLNAADSTIQASNLDNRIGNINPIQGDIDLSNLVSLNLSNSLIQVTTQSGIAGSISVNESQSAVTTFEMTNSQILADATASGGEAGSITLNTVVLDAVNSAIRAANVDNTSGIGGDIDFQGVSTLDLTNSTITAATQTGRAGSMTLNENETPAQAVTLTNSRILVEANDETPTIALGNAGNILFNTQKLSLSGSQISASTEAGRGRDIDLQNLETLSLSNSRISASTQTGGAGNVFVNQNQVPAQQIQLLAQSSLAAEATGDGGNAGIIAINGSEISVANGSSITTSNVSGVSESNIRFENTDQLTITDGSEVAASTQSGRAGSILLNTAATPATQLNLFNNSRMVAEAIANAPNSSSGNITLYAQSINIENNSTLSIITVAGEGGNLTLQNLEDVAVANSLITAATDTGIAGDIQLDFINSTLTLTGTNEAGRGGIVAEATGIGGQAGDIIINIPSGAVSINQGSEVTVSSPQGVAGGITIDANTLSLDQGLLKAETGQTPASGSGATITLVVDQQLRLENESQISASAFNQANGGNIAINTLVLVAFPPTGANGSDVIANAEGGNGGFISLTATGVFGIRFRDQLTSLNDFTVSSQAGSSGIVVLDIPDVDPSQGLTAIPINLTDPSSLINDQCRVGSGEQGEFTITGRGGLPVNPLNLLHSPQPLGDLGPNLANPIVPEAQQPEDQSSQNAPYLQNDRPQFLTLSQSSQHLESQHRRAQIRLSQGCRTFE